MAILKLRDKNGNIIEVPFFIGPPGKKGDKGDPGYTPVIGVNGHWYINGVDTGEKAIGTVITNVYINNEGHLIVVFNDDSELDAGEITPVDVTVSPEDIESALDSYLKDHPIVTEETDPTVPDWAKSGTKPTYTAAEVGAVPMEGFDTTLGQYIRAHNNNDEAHNNIRELINKKAGKDEIPTVPKNISEFNNDAGFITKAVSDLVNYYTKNTTYTREEVNSLVSAIPKFSISVVSALPTSSISDTTIYLLGGGSGDDLYTEYIYVDGKWEILGSQRVDLTGYATEAWVNNQLGSYLKQTSLTEAINTALAQAKASGEFDGKDGYTPEIGANGNWWINGEDTGKTALGTVITNARINEAGHLIVTFADGSSLDAGPAKGDPYTLTDTDKASISAAVKSSLKSESWTFELENGTTVTKVVLLA